MTKINSFKISRTRNAADYEYHHQVIDLALGCNVIKSTMGKYFNPYKTAFDEFERLMAITRKNELTPKIADLDKVRDGIVRAIRAAVFGLLKSLDEDQKAAATAVWNTLESVKVQYDTQYVEETGQIDNLLMILQGEQQTAVQSLGLLPLVEELKQANDQVHQLVSDREQVIGDRFYGSLAKARTAADNAYRSFREYVNAYWMVNSSQLSEEQYAELLGFIDAVNNVIALFDRVVIKSGTVADKEEIDGEEPTPEFPDDSDDEDQEEPPAQGGQEPENPEPDEGGGSGGGGSTIDPDNPWYDPENEPD